MKITLNAHEFVEQFVKVRPDNFSREALKAIFEHIDELERDCGEETEFDPIGICCEWTEFETVEEAARAFGWEAKEVEDERADTSDRDALWFLNDEVTAALELPSGGVVVLNV